MKADWLQQKIKSNIKYHKRIKSEFFFIDFQFAEYVGSLRHKKEHQKKQRVFAKDPTICILFDKQDNAHTK